MPDPSPVPVSYTDPFGVHIDVVAAGPDYTVRCCTPSDTTVAPWYEVDVVYPRPRSALSAALVFVPEALHMYDAEVDSQRGRTVFFFGSGNELAAE